MTFPEGRDSLIRMSIAAGNTYRPDLRTQMTVAAASGELVSLSTYDLLSPARKLRAWVRFGHTAKCSDGLVKLSRCWCRQELWFWSGPAGFALGYRRVRSMVGSRAD